MWKPKYLIILFFNIAHEINVILRELFLESLSSYFKYSFQTLSISKPTIYYIYIYNLYTFYMRIYECM